MDRRLAALALALVVALMAACSGPPGATIALPGTTWSVTTVGGATTVAASPPTMAFGVDGKLSGSTGCNTYTGAYTLDGASLTIGPLAMTAMLCQGPVGVQETAFTAALQKATAWSIGGDGVLSLTGTADIVAKSVGGG